MFNVVPLQVEHVRTLAVEPSNSFLAPWIDSGYVENILQTKFASAGFVSGDLTVAAGFSECWANRAHLWCLWSKKAALHFVPVFRGIKKFVDSSPYRRVEIEVPLDMPFTDMARKRAELLGFNCDCERAKGYRPGGGDSALYSRVRGA